MGEPTTPSRRRFLGTAARASAATACAGLSPWTAGCASFPRVSPAVEGGVASIPLTAFQGAAGVLFDHPTESFPVYVHRHASGRFTAVLMRCTHRGCEVEPTPERMVCPCHGSEYELDGVLLEGPAQEPLTPYPATARGDRVLVGLTPEDLPS